MDIVATEKNLLLCFTILLQLVERKSLLSLTYLNSVRQCHSITGKLVALRSTSTTSTKLGLPVKKKTCTLTCSEIHENNEETANMTSLDKIAQLKQLLYGMEKDLGLNDLSMVQKNIVYAATILAKVKDQIETDELRSHELLEGTSRSSFFRALRELVHAGYLAHSDGVQRSAYTLTSKLR